MRCLTQAIELLPALIAEPFEHDSPVGQRDAFVLIASGEDAIQKQTMSQRARRTGQWVDCGRRRAGERPARHVQSASGGWDKEAIADCQPRQGRRADSA